MISSRPKALRPASCKKTDSICDSVPQPELNAKAFKNLYVALPAAGSGRKKVLILASNEHIRNFHGFINEIQGFILFISPVGSETET